MSLRLVKRILRDCRWLLIDSTCIHGSFTMNKFSHQIILKTTRTQRITSERKNLTLFAIHFPIVCIFGNSQWFNLFRRAFGKKKISTAFSFSNNFSEIQNIVPNVRSTLVLELESNVQ